MNIIMIGGTKCSFIIKCLCCLLLFMLIYVSLCVDCRKNKSSNSNNNDNDKKLIHQKHNNLESKIKNKNKIPNSHTDKKLSKSSKHKRPSKSKLDSISRSRSRSSSLFDHINNPFFGIRKPDYCGKAIVNIPISKQKRKNDGDDDDDDDDDNENSYIIGGRLARLGWFPWHVEIFCDNGNSSRCGGSIVSRNRILTAAHCILPKSRNYTACKTVKIIAGTVETRIDPIFKYAQIKESDYYITSNIFLQDHKSFDLALINLSEQLQFTKYVQAICVPTGPISYDDCFAYGGGRKDYGKPTNQTLYQRMKHKPNCNIGDDNDFGKDRPEICFQGIGGNRNGAPCLGDSGSGLFCRQKGNVWYIAGSVSFGDNRKCLPKKELWAAFINTVYLNDFIRELDSELNKLILADEKNVKLNIESKKVPSAGIAFGPFR